MDESEMDHVEESFVSLSYVINFYIPTTLISNFYPPKLL